MTLYANMKFREYEFHEYPKMVYPKPGKPGILVQNATEEEAAMGGVQPVSAEEQHAKLVAIADLEGVKIDKRWGVDRLRAEIDKHRDASKGAN